MQSRLRRLLEYLNWYGCHAEGTHECEMFFILQRHHCTQVNLKYPHEYNIHCRYILLYNCFLLNIRIFIVFGVNKDLYNPWCKLFKPFELHQCYITPYPLYILQYSNLSSFLSLLIVKPII